MMMYVFVITFMLQDEVGQGHSDLGLFGEGNITGLFLELEDCLKEKERMENAIFGLVLETSGQMSIESHCDLVEAD